MLLNPVSTKTGEDQRETSRWTSEAARAGSSGTPWPSRYSLASFPQLSGTPPSQALWRKVAARVKSSRTRRAPPAAANTPPPEYSTPSLAQASMVPASQSRSSCSTSSCARRGLGLQTSAPTTPATSTHRKMGRITHPASLGEIVAAWSAVSSSGGRPTEWASTAAAGPRGPPAELLFQRSLIMNSA